MQIIRQWDYTELNPPSRILIEDKKCSLEIGCGNGLFLSSIASQHPDEVFVGMEIKHKCIVKAQKKCETLVKLAQIQDENIILLNGDIFTGIDVFFVEQTFDNIYINFPDPWFKQRHLKKRVVNPEMVVKYAGLLKCGGRLYFVTDNEIYRDFAVGNFVECSLFESIFEAPFYTEQLQWYPQSLYEKKWRQAGRHIYYSGFVKKG